MDKYRNLAFQLSLLPIGLFEFLFGLCERLFGMELGIDLPPEFRREIGSVVADTLEVVEVLRRNRLEELSDAAHGDERQAVARSAGIEPGNEILHKLPALRLASLLNASMKV